MASEIERQSERQQISVRLPIPLVAKIDERANRFGYSRNEWLERALTRLVEMPSQITREERRF